MSHLIDIFIDDGFGFEDGVATLRSEWIYRTKRAANQWLRLTQSLDYPYYRVELDQLTRILDSSELLGSTRFDQVVCVGAADGAKEAKIGLRAARNCPCPEFLLVDSSQALLDHALEKFSHLGLFALQGALIDVRDVVAFKNAIQNHDRMRNSPRLFTAFGNMVGNYSGLSLVSSLHQAMVRHDRLVFGVHLKSLAKSNLTYPAYHSSSYYDHMYSVLQDVGIDPKSGKIRTVENSNGNGLVDTVEIFFDLNNELTLDCISTPDDLKLSQEIRHIKVDVSFKYSLEFLLSELSQLQWHQRSHWITECGTNAIFSCER